MASPLIGIAPSFQPATRNGGALRLWRNYPGLFAQEGALPVLLPLLETRRAAFRDVFVDVSLANQLADARDHRASVLCERRDWEKEENEGGAHTAHDGGPPAVKS